MSLLERSENLRDKREKVERLKTTEQETKRLRALSKELFSDYEGLLSVLSVCDLFVREQINFERSSSTSINQGLTLVSKMRILFSENPQSTTLISGTNWPQLKKNIKATRSQIESCIHVGWDDFSKGFLVGLKPEMLEGAIVPTEENLKLLAQYKETYRSLSQLSRQKASTETIRTLKEMGKLKLDIAKQLEDFKAPESVKLFLRAISGNGASLELLTEDVVAWLKEQDHFEKYKIVGVS